MSKTTFLGESPLRDNIFRANIPNVNALNVRKLEAVIFILYVIDLKTPTNQLDVKPFEC